MKTTFDTNAFLYQLVTSAIGTTLTGGVWQIERPLDSKNEDIVVGTLPLDENQIAVCNVNIFVPDKAVGIAGKTNMVADLHRLGELTNIVVDALDQDTDLAQNYHYRITNQSLIEVPDTDQHFVNLRLELRLYF